MQDDLKLAPGQRERVAATLQDIGRAKRTAGPDTRRRVLDEMKEHEEAVTLILTPDQFRRLGQIALQLRGPDAFREPEVVAALRLTREQKDRLRDLGGPPFLRGGGRPGPPDGRPGREPWTSRVFGVLTPDQKARWEELTGERYTGPVPMFFRGPGRPHHDHLKEIR